MDLILLERIEKLGIIGDVVSVKPGYGRNYLLPQGKAMRATEANKAAFEARRAQIEADNIKRREEAEKVAERMADAMFVVIRQASEAGMLYGSVASRDVAEGLDGLGFTVSRTQVIQERPIKMLGIHDIRVKLHPEVDVVVKANVAKSADEAEMQLAVYNGEEVLTDEQREEAEAAAEAAAAAENDPDYNDDGEE